MHPSGVTMRDCMACHARCLNGCVTVCDHACIGCDLAWEQASISLALSLQIEAIRKDMKQKEQVEEAYKDAGEDGQGGAEDNLDDDAKIAEDEEGGE